MLVYIRHSSYLYNGALWFPLLYYTEGEPALHNPKVTK